jgi:2,4-dienoyl-CoA reductase-like NADH-dependent reductase (Old Yellow Enzyme family)
MKLLEQGSIASMTVKNRVIMAPMTTRLPFKDNRVSPALTRYLEERAAGGVGLITLELCSPTADGAHRGSEVGIYDDRFIEGLARLVSCLHEHGARCSIQIGHAGAHTPPQIPGARAVAPSAVPHVVYEGDMRTTAPAPLSREQMASLADAYAAAAYRCELAGFDMIELQGGHDYLLSQFLSPIDNRRTDDYGGSLENRARFPIEVLRACRERLSIPISYRLSADHLTPGGVTIEDTERIAPMLEEAGADLINVSGGTSRSTIPDIITIPMSYPAGLFVPFAERLKRVVDIPVAVAGRLHDPALAESVLQTGCADFVVLGRALIADPHWVRKVEARDFDRIRPCLACNTCSEHLEHGSPIACVVNPLAAREAELTVASSNSGDGKKALVLGGGPSGLTAAAALADKGYDVELWEKSASLGGRLRSIHKGPRFQTVATAPEPFEALIFYLVSEIRRRGVRIRLRVRPQVSDIVEFNPACVVVATGAVYQIPGMLLLLHLPGIRRLAASARLHKHFFKLLRPSRDHLPQQLTRAGLRVLVVGDRGQSRGVELAIRSAFVQVHEL